MSRQQLLEIVKRMRRNPEADFCTETTASGLGLDPAEMVRQFRQLTGVSPLRFRAALRIEMAKRELIAGDSSVTAISLRCGYESLGTFIRTFTLRVGLSPAAFRQAVRGSDLHPVEQWTSPGMSGEASLFGFAPDPDPATRMLVAVGLFQRGVPAGAPLSGQILINGGRFGLTDSLSHGWRYLLGFAAPWGTSLWLPSGPDIFVFSHRIRRQSDEALAVPELKWRRLTITDPPIVLALPALLGGISNPR